MADSVPAPASFTNSSSISSIKELFSQSWNLFTRSILNLFLITIFSIATSVALLIIFGISFFLFGFSTYLNIIPQIKQGIKPDISPTVLITGVILLIIFTIVFLIVGYSFQIAQIIVVAEVDKKTSIKSALRRGFKYILPLFITNLIVGFLTIGSLFLFIFPALLLFFFFLFVTYEVVLADKKYFTAIGRSIYIVSQHFGDILIRVIIYILFYIFLVVFIPNLIRKIEPSTYLFLTFLSILTNTLIGWFGFTYFLTLYKEAKKDLDQEKKSSLLWVWIISILGWVIAGILIIAVIKTASSNLFQKLTSSPSSIALRKQVNAVKEMNPEAKKHWDRSQQLFEQMKALNKTDTQSGVVDKIKAINDENIAELKKAIEADPQNARLWVDLGAAYTWVSTKGTLQDSYLAYKKAVDLEPDNPIYNDYVGEALVSLGKYDEAVVVLNKSVRMNGNNESGYTYQRLASAYEHLKIYDQARANYQKALDVFQKENINGSYDEVILEVEKALARIPKI